MCAGVRGVRCTLNTTAHVSTRHTPHVTEQNSIHFDSSLLQLRIFILTSFCFYSPLATSSSSVFNYPLPPHTHHFLFFFFLHTHFLNKKLKTVAASQGGTFSKIHARIAPLISHLHRLNAQVYSVCNVSSCLSAWLSRNIWICQCQLVLFLPNIMFGQAKKNLTHMANSILLSFNTIFITLHLWLGLISMTSHLLALL